MKGSKNVNQVKKKKIAVDSCKAASLVDLETTSTTLSGKTTRKNMLLSLQNHGTQVTESKNTAAVGSGRHKISKK